MKKEGPDIRDENVKTMDELKTETIKWLDKLEKEIKDIQPTDKLDKKIMKGVIENIKAYIQDTKHFLKKKDYTRAFEAIIYAWGIWETIRRCNLVENVKQSTTD